MNFFDNYIVILVFMLVLLVIFVIYNQFKIIKKISYFENEKDKNIQQNVQNQTDDIVKNNPIKAAVIMAAINQHRTKMR